VQDIWCSRSSTKYASARAGHMMQPVFNEICFSMSRTYDAAGLQRNILQQEQDLLCSRSLTKYASARAGPTMQPVFNEICFSESRTYYAAGL
jgi:hypothetical protein